MLNLFSSEVWTLIAKILMLDPQWQQISLTLHSLHPPTRASKPPRLATPVGY